MENPPIKLVLGLFFIQTVVLYPEIVRLLYDTARIYIFKESCGLGW